MADEQRSIAQELSTQVSDLVNNILARHGGGMMSGFVIMVDFLDEDGDPSWAWSCAPDQRLGTSVSIARMAWTKVDLELRRHLDDGDTWPSGD